MRILTILTMFLLAAMSLRAQSRLPGPGSGLPDMPKPKVEMKGPVVDRRFVLAVTVLAVAKTADAISTVRGLGRGNVEQNPIFGARPGAWRLAGVNAGYFAGEVGLAYVVKRAGRGRWWGRAWPVEIGWQTGAHLRAAVGNERLRGRR